MVAESAAFGRRPDGFGFPFAQLFDPSLGDDATQLSRGEFARFRNDDRGQLAIYTEREHAHVIGAPADT